MTEMPRIGSGEPIPPLPRGGESFQAISLSKVFHSDNVVIKAVDNVSFRIERGERLGILGGNGAGKSTLIKILSGVMTPTSGAIRSDLTVSWPLALGGGFFEGHLNGYDNIRFVARLYKRPYQDILDYVSWFSELTRKQLQTPVRFFSSGMTMRLAFALSLSIDFDVVLIDEVLVVGDRRIQQRCLDEVFTKRPDRSVILAVHNSDIVQEYCDRALVMKSGRGRLFEDLALAAKIYSTL